MCGIWISLGHIPDRSHLDIIAHRGPDGDGWQVFETPRGPLAFGHRRLAIIDTGDGGIQPMSYSDGRLWITYNGEIYNYLELREELRALGHRFVTQSDTEVILAAYAQWGRDALHRLRGMFALGLYDRQAAKLLLARDRFGIKPLYFVRTASGLAAGSEIKQLLSLPDVSSRINPRRAYDFLAGGTLDHSDETMFRDVKQLQGGEWLEVDLSNGSITRDRWYTLPPPGSVKLSRAEAAARFLELLQDSVRLHLRADVEVGSCLSGGLDSSTLVMLMAERLEALGSGERLNTVTARFEGTAVDETRYADIVSNAARAQSHAARPRADDIMQEASQIVWHQDEPYGSTSIHAQWHVFAQTHANQLKVMLDGQGADEILGGYHSVYDVRYAELMRQWRLGAAIILVARRKQFFNHPLLPQLVTGAAHLSSSSSAMRVALSTVLKLARRRTPNSTVPALEPWLRQPAFGLAGPPYGTFEKALSDAGLAPPTDLASFCVGLTQVGSVPALLHWEDRNSMAHGVEARVPFLDHPLVEFAIGLGGEHKLVDGWTKWVMRSAMKGRLPEAVRLRKDKLGFATPEAAWMRGALRDPIVESINTTKQLFPEHFNLPATDNMVAEMLDGRRPIDFTLWRIACFGIWAKRFGMTF